MASKKEMKEMKETAAKAAVKAEEVRKAVGEKVEETLKEAEKKVDVAKKAVKKAAAKKDFRTDIILQYGEKEVNTKDMVAAVKKEWTRGRHKVSDIKTMELYVKPEDYAVYYVINGEETGKVWL